MLGFVGLAICAILPICLAGQGDPERHSLYYVYTALSKAVNAPGIFEFTAMGLLDERKIDYYDSKHQVKVPQQDWMKTKLPADYWEKGTQSRKSKEQWFKVNVNILMERMRQNQSDIHVLMWKHGCEIDRSADGAVKFVRGVDAYSYDGNDFLSFDDASMQWVAPVTEAVPTKQKWDGVPILNQYTKGYLEKECVDWLEKFREYGDKELKQQTTASPPDVRLFAKAAESSNTFKLTCMATGFYPKDIDITILKGKEVIKKGDLRDVLPNGDGTHQIKLIVEAQRSDIDGYSCDVKHVGLDEPIRKIWTVDGEVCDETSSFLIGAVIGVLAVLLMGILVLFIAYKKGLIGPKTTDQKKGPPPEVVVPSVMGNVSTPLLGNGQANGSTGQDANGTASTVVLASVMGNLSTPLLGNGQANGSTGQDGNGTASTVIGVETTLLQDGSGKLEDDTDSVNEGDDADSGRGNPEGSTNNSAEQLNMNGPSPAVVPSVMSNVGTPLLGNGQANGSTGQDANGTASTVIGVETTLLQDGSGKLEDDADSGNSSNGSSKSSAENVSADGGDADSGRGNPEGSTNNSAEK
ncbi:class I histocompatibility antigen, F10 alpha chain-like isoform X2 [Sardina pilchardus]|uniref:class I histocompatibility antigen, F10 alpha chain-like isoform X2 n=1 Tax=Sardina pilchardus TaxID=27697 RepID=UPI002E144A6D